jgi:hypothetical protein
MVSSRDQSRYRQVVTYIHRVMIKTEEYSGYLFDLPCLSETSNDRAIAGPSYYEQAPYHRTCERHTSVT